MATNRNLLKSPVGEIQFMAAKEPVESTNGKIQYTIKIAYDVKKDKEFLTTVSNINDAKVVTAQSYRGKSQAIKDLLSTGKALVSASSIFQPIVYDAAGNELEEAPMFYSDSVGTAQMIVQPYKGERGGTLNLIAIKIHTLETPQQEGTSREERLAQLRALVNAK